MCSQPALYLIASVPYSKTSFDRFGVSCQTVTTVLISRYHQSRYGSKERDRRGKHAIAAVGRQPCSKFKLLYPHICSRHATRLIQERARGAVAPTQPPYTYSLVISSASSLIPSPCAHIVYDVWRPTKILYEHQSSLLCLTTRIYRPNILGNCSPRRDSQGELHLRE